MPGPAEDIDEVLELDEPARGDLVDRGLLAGLQHRVAGVDAALVVDELVRDGAAPLGLGEVVGQLDPAAVDAPGERGVANVAEADLQPVPGAGLPLRVPGSSFDRHARCCTRTDRQKTL